MMSIHIIIYGFKFNSQILFYASAREKINLAMNIF